MITSRLASGHRGSIGQASDPSAPRHDGLSRVCCDCEVSPQNILYVAIYCGFMGGCGRVSQPGKALTKNGDDRCLSGWSAGPAQGGGVPGDEPASSSFSSTECIHGNEWRQFVIDAASAGHDPA